MRCAPVADKWQFDLRSLPDGEAFVHGGSLTKWGSPRNPSSGSLHWMVEHSCTVSVLCCDFLSAGHWNYPIVPSLVVGVLAAAILFVNINLPKVIETLCSVAVVWANLAYLFVTVPLLVARLRRGNRGLAASRGDSTARQASQGDHRHPPIPGFSLGAWGMPVNAIAVVWGLFVVINIGWPRAEIHGSGDGSRFAALLATLGLIIAGTIYYLLFQRKRTGILLEHAVGDGIQCQSSATDNRPVDPRWIGQLAPGE